MRELIGVRIRCSSLLAGTMLLTACVTSEKSDSNRDGSDQAGKNSAGSGGVVGSGAGQPAGGSFNGTGTVASSIAGDSGLDWTRGGSSGGAVAAATHVAGSGGDATIPHVPIGGLGNGSGGRGVGGNSSSGSLSAGTSGLSTGLGVGGQSKTSAPSAMPPELVGVWQETRASSGDYKSSNGTTFSLTSGFSVQLKLSGNGAYYLANFGSGVTQNCATVTQFEQSVGVAELDGNALLFHPTEHALDVTDCSGTARIDLGQAPFALQIALEEAQHYYGGIRTFRMQATGGPHPYDLMLLHRPPLSSPQILPQPADFVLGTDGPYQEFQGLWVAAAGTDSTFFNPTTGEYHFPELNGNPHAWIHLGADGYEAAIALQNVNSDGPCKSDVIYYEQGETRLAVLENVNGANNHFVGHARFTSSAGRMIVRIRECKENDGVAVYDIPPAPRYYRFIYFSPDAPPERIIFPCDFPLNEWQSILCDAFPKGFIRR